MDLVSNGIIIVLKYLLPGFVSAWIFYGLTAWQKPPEFERVIQAFIFNMFVQVLVIFTSWTFFLFGKYVHSFGSWTANVSLFWSLIVAILFGLAVSYFANNDTIHAFLRRKNITQQTSYPSEWFGAFRQNKTYVVLNLKGERRLYG